MSFVNSLGQILAGLRPKRSYLPHIQSVRMPREGKMQPLKIAILFLCSMQCFASEFETHLWPEEGRPLLKALTASLKLRETPYATSEIASQVSVKIGIPMQGRVFFHIPLLSTCGCCR